MRSIHQELGELNEEALELAVTHFDLGDRFLSKIDKIKFLSEIKEADSPRARSLRDRHL
jgi:hypothetical protein